MQLLMCGLLSDIYLTLKVEEEKVAQFGVVNQVSYTCSRDIIQLCLPNDGSIQDLFADQI